MPHTWEKALDSYQYPVHLAVFEGARPGSFEYDTGNGDQAQTMEFETRFRERGPCNLEAWAEVVFWKLYTIPPARQKTTKQVLASRVTAAELWQHCANYIEKPTLQSFQAFREKLFKEPVVATAATFPAFICPEKFPMVDKQVTKWARTEGTKHSYAAIGGPSFSRVPELGKKGVRESDWAFVESWIDWCQFTAGILNQRTERHWRARDVEMAVFTAQISQKYPDPGRRLTLHPLA